jgi:hypothetical protein
MLNVPEEQLSAQRPGKSQGWASKRRYQVAGAAVLLAVASSLLLVLGRGGSPGLSCASLSAGYGSELPSASLGRAGPTTLLIAASSLVVGQTVDTTVAAQLSDSDSVNAFDVSLEYDASVGTLEIVCPAPGWEGLLVNSWSNSTGRARIAAYRLGEGCGSGQQCALFVTRWRGSKAGLSPIAVAAVALAGRSKDAPGLIDVGPIEAGSLTVLPAP